MSRNLIPVLIFLFALFFILTFSNPALFLNDEWITVNQLHQLGEGHQLIVNEGKYGTFQNGTPGPYFLDRHNLLGYSLMLPILSLPALWFFGLFGDQFRLAVVLLWSFLPVAMAVLVEAYRPEWARWKGIRWTWLAIGAAFVGFLSNVLLYYPWPFTASDAPVEAAAVVFTNHLIFAALAVMVYLICRTIFEDTWFSIFGTFACISCSSYIFWAANAKDHILVAAMVAAVILFMVWYIRYGDLRDAAVGFGFVGLLAWARPEVGLTVFLAAIAYYVLHVTMNAHRSSDYSGLARSFAAPFFTFAGAVPLFLNNFYVTDNPLVPAFYVYEKQLTQVATDSSVDVIGADVAGNISQSVPAPSGGLEGFFNVFTNHFTPLWSTLPGDVLGILFAPESGNMSLVAVSPLIVIALVVLPIVLWRKPERFSTVDRWLILFIALIGIAVWVAYLRSLHGLNISHGITPDIRYLVPFYLPVGLLGVYAMRKLLDPNGKLLSLYNIWAVLLATPLLILLMLLIQPYGGMYAGYTAFFTQINFLLIALLLLMIILTPLTSIDRRWFFGLVTLLLATPLAWQMMMVFLYSVSKFNGYPLWVPIVDALYNSCIGVIEMPH